MDIITKPYPSAPLFTKCELVQKGHKCGLCGRPRGCCRYSLPLKAVWRRSAASSVRTKRRSRGTSGDQLVSIEAIVSVFDRAHRCTVYVHCSVLGCHVRDGHSVKHGRQRKPLGKIQLLEQPYYFSGYLNPKICVRPSISAACHTKQLVRPKSAWCKVQRPKLALTLCNLKVKPYKYQTTSYSLDVELPVPLDNAIDSKALGLTYTAVVYERRPLTQLRQPFRSAS